VLDAMRRTVVVAAARIPLGAPTTTGVKLADFGSASETTVFVARHENGCIRDFHDV
jgi:hypothetical protein